MVTWSFVNGSLLLATWDACKPRGSDGGHVLKWHNGSGGPIPGSRYRQTLEIGKLATHLKGPTSLLLGFIFRFKQAPDGAESAGQAGRLGAAVIGHFVQLRQDAAASALHPCRHPV